VVSQLSASTAACSRARAWRPVWVGWAAMHTATCWHCCAATARCQLLLWRAAVLLCGHGSACMQQPLHIMRWVYADTAKPPWFCACVPLQVLHVHRAAVDGHWVGGMHRHCSGTAPLETAAMRWSC
jgi:hypothetical protein